MFMRIPVPGYNIINNVVMLVYKSLRTLIYDGYIPRSGVVASNFCINSSLQDTIKEFTKSV